MSLSSRLSVFAEHLTHAGPWSDPCITQGSDRLKKVVGREAPHDAGDFLRQLSTCTLIHADALGPTLSGLWDV